ncbi:MAG TPA: hypothetical protein VKP03_02115 [Patescibacteria group bacterium]|nr:hypothetical protein [Patescibacteria group bacterium]
MKRSSKRVIRRGLDKIQRFWWIPLALLAVVILLKGFHVHGQLCHVEKAFVRATEQCRPNSIGGLDCHGACDKVLSRRDELAAENRCFILGRWRVVQVNGGSDPRAKTVSIPICSPF